MLAQACCRPPIFSPILLPFRPHPLPSSPPHTQRHRFLHLSLPIKPPSPPSHLICKAAEYVFPDPIPEFAETEVSKFRTHLVERLSKKKDLFGDSIEQVVGVCIEEVSKFRTHLVERLSKKKDLFGDSLEQVVGVCTEILSTFLNTEYGGPGTLLVIPFIDMADTLNERGLPGGPQAARAAVVWAQKHLDDDWDEWVGGTQ